MTIFQFFNQHSYLLISAIVLSIAAIALVRRHARRAWLIWLSLVAVALAGWLVLRTGQGATFNSVGDYEAALRSGQPTLVEFYSDY
jgi:ABC-type uncharacterized transport system permease subunit